MYRITKIEVQKKDDTRSSVFVNGYFEFGAPTKLLTRYNVVEGMEFDEVSYQELLERIQLERARNRVFDYLARGGKTEKQVKDKLIDWEYSLSIVNKLMAFLKEYHYVDDTAYAKRYIESKVIYGKKSLRQAQSLLYAKGIKQVDKEILDEQLEDAEYENILYYLNKLKYSRDLDREYKQKIIGKLMNRGFNYTMIDKMMRQIDENYTG